MCWHLFFGTLAGVHLSGWHRGPGIAGEFFKGEVYGPALYHAHRLESEVAQYPRIVVGSALVDYIKNETLRPLEHEAAELIRGMAKRCLKLLCVDLDGVTILDYAGAASRGMFPTLQSSIEPAIEFATREWQRFQKEGNHKLAGRYFMLINYLRSRRQL